MIDYATPWSFLLLWKVIWEQQKLNLALGEINSQKIQNNTFRRNSQLHFSTFCSSFNVFEHYFKTISSTFLAFFWHFFPALFKDFSITIKKGLCVKGVGYVDFKPRNAGLLSTSVGDNILNFKACLVNELINIRFFMFLKDNN